MSRLLADTDATGKGQASAQLHSGGQPDSGGGGLLPTAPALHQTNASKRKTCYIRMSEGLLATVVVAMLAVGGQLRSRRAYLLS